MLPDSWIGRWIVSAPNPSALSQALGFVQIWPSGHLQVGRRLQDGYRQCSWTLPRDTGTSAKVRLAASPKCHSRAWELQALCHQGRVSTLFHRKYGVDDLLSFLSVEGIVHAKAELDDLKQNNDRYEEKLWIICALLYIIGTNSASSIASFDIQPFREAREPRSLGQATSSNAKLIISTKRLRIPRVRFISSLSAGRSSSLWTICYDIPDFHSCGVYQGQGLVHSIQCCPARCSC